MKASVGSYWRRTRNQRVKPRHSLLETGRSYGPLLQILQKMYQGWGKWQKGKKCRSITLGWQVRFPSVFLKCSSLILFADVVLNSNCETSFLYCGWYYSARTFHVPGEVAKALVKLLQNPLKFSLVRDFLQQSSPGLWHTITPTPFGIWMWLIFNLDLSAVRDFLFLVQIGKCWLCAFFCFFIVLFHV